jgi:hypothetical protein
VSHDAAPCPGLSLPLPKEPRNFPIAHPSRRNRNRRRLTYPIRHILFIPKAPSSYPNLDIQLVQNLTILVILVTPGIASKSILLPLLKSMRSTSLAAAVATAFGQMDASH